MHARRGPNPLMLLRLLPPPTRAYTTYHSQVLHSAGAAAARAFGSLDKALENAGVLPELAPPPVLSALETQEFKQVGGRTLVGRRVVGRAGSCADGSLQHQCKFHTGTASTRGTNTPPLTTYYAVILLQIRAKLDKLELSVSDVVAVEHARIARTGDMTSPAWVKAPFYALCFVLDVMYPKNKAIEVKAGRGRARGIEARARRISLRIGVCFKGLTLILYGKYGVERRFPGGVPSKGAADCTPKPVPPLLPLPCARARTTNRRSSGCSRRWRASPTSPTSPSCTCTSRWASGGPARSFAKFTLPRSGTVCLRVRACVWLGCLRGRGGHMGPMCCTAWTEDSLYLRRICDAFGPTLTPHLCRC